MRTAILALVLVCSGCKSTSKNDPVTVLILPRVTDTSGGSLPGVVLTLTTQGRRVTEITSAEGQAVFVWQWKRLPDPSPFVLESSLDGFATVTVKNLEFKPGYRYRLDGIEIPLASKIEEIVITLGTFEYDEGDVRVSSKNDDDGVKLVGRPRYGEEDR